LIWLFIDAVSADFGVEFEQKTSGNDATVLADVIWAKFNV
jgi:hypothetical protein